MEKTSLKRTGTRPGLAVLSGSSLAGRRKGWTALLLAGAVLICFISSAGAEMPQRPKGTGTLTSIQEDGALIISERGYNISPRAVILDSQDKKTSLDKFTLPTVVTFEYVYTRDGAEIRLIREMAQ